MGLLDGLEAYWSCDEGSGNRVDSHTNGLDFIETGGVGSAAGKINLAVDGTGNPVNILDQPSTARLLFGDEAMAISCWANVNAGEQFNNGPILAVWEAAGDQRAWLLWYRQNVRRWQFMVSGDGINSTPLNSASAPPFDGTFQHIVAQHDPVADVITVQVNDGTVQSTPYSAGLFAASTARPGLGVISQVAGAIVHIQHVDEIGIWRRLLTTAEVPELFNGGAALPFSSFTFDPLSTHVQNRYSTQYLVELTNPQDRNATEINVTLLNNAFTDISSLFEVHAGVTYDDSDPRHIATAVEGIIALLMLRTGQTAAAGRMGAWLDSVRALGEITGRNRVTPDSTTKMQPSEDDRLTSTPRPAFDDRRFDAFLPSSPAAGR